MTRLNLNPTLTNPNQSKPNHQQGATGEVELVKGNKIKVTTSDEFKEKCDANVLYVDYQNINKVVKPGSHVYVDDGLISLVVKSIGE